MESRRQEWRDRLAEFSRSGMTVVDWCSAHDVRDQQFYRWRRKQVASVSNAEAQSPAWMTLSVMEDKTTGITVRMGHAAIDVQPGFDAATLRAVVAALTPAPC
jgi:transposase-like protein